MSWKIAGCVKLGETWFRDAPTGSMRTQDLAICQRDEALSAAAELADLLQDVCGIDVDLYRNEFLDVKFQCRKALDKLRVKKDLKIERVSWRDGGEGLVHKVNELIEAVNGLKGDR